MTHTSLDMALQWWVVGVEVPVIGGLLWLILKVRRDVEHRRDELREALIDRERNLMDTVNAFKLDVAKHYASLDHLKEVEGRLTDHLNRIEQKVTPLLRGVPFNSRSHHEPADTA